MNFINIIWEEHEQKYTYEINRFNFNVIRIIRSAWLWMWSVLSVQFHSAENNNLIDWKEGGGGKWGKREKQVSACDGYFSLSACPDYEIP